MTAFWGICGAASQLQAGNADGRACGVQAAARTRMACPKRRYTGSDRSVDLVLLMPSWDILLALAAAFPEHGARFSSDGKWRTVHSMALGGTQFTQSVHLITCAHSGGRASTTASISWACSATCTLLQAT